MKIIAPLIALSLLASPAAASGLKDVASNDMPTASFNQNGFSVGAGVGTLGLGVEAGYRFNSRIGVRGVYNGFDYDTERELEGADLDVNASLKTGGVMVDIYPFGGNFRVSGGALINKNKATAAGVYTDEFTFEGQTYTPTEETRIDGILDWEDDLAPVATVGYHGNLGRHVSIGAEIGALFTGSAQIDAEASGDPNVVAQIQDDLDDSIADIQDELDKVGVYPIAKIGLNIRF